MQLRASTGRFTPHASSSPLPVELRTGNRLPLRSSTTLHRKTTPSASASAASMAGEGSGRSRVHARASSSLQEQPRLRMTPGRLTSTVRPGGVHHTFCDAAVRECVRVTLVRAADILVNDLFAKKSPCEMSVCVVLRYVLPFECV